MRRRMFSRVLAAGALLAMVARPGLAQRRPMSEKARANLQEKIRHELVMLPYYGVFDYLAYRLDHNYTVTLLGAVTRPTLKSGAEDVVKKIEGVERVVNNIEVLPLSSFDDGIRRATYRSIFSTPGLDRYALQSVPPIHILVKRGHVTLAGVVRTEAEKNLAGIKANSVSGVFSVQNQLVVEKPRRG